MAPSGIERGTGF